MNNILITGANGFIGNNFNLFLKKKKIKNVYLTHRNYPKIDRHKLSIKFDEKNKIFYVDLLKLNDVKKIFNIIRPKIIFHFAGKPRKKKIHIHSLEMVNNIIKSMDKNSLFIFTSTDKIYSLKPKDNTEVAHIKFKKLQGYEKYKYLSEKIIQKKLSKYYIFRLPPVHAKGDYRNKFASYLDSQAYLLKKNKKVKVFSNIYRSFLKVQEFSSFLYKLVFLKNNLIYGIYNLGCSPYSYYDRMVQIVNSKKNIIKIKGEVKPLKQSLNTTKINKNGFYFT